MINNIKIEICLGNVQDVYLANQYPIDRIELNSALELGGLSASLETLKVAKEIKGVPIVCMVRPRGGDFCYCDEEYEVMIRDANNFLQAKADGIVFGFLNADKTINIERTRQMCELAHSYKAQAIFHKAFDEVENSDEAIQQLIDCGIDRILTSGKEPSENILKGCELVNDLYQKYGKQIELLPGGGVRIDNVQQVIKTANSGQVHMTSKKQNPGGYICLDTDQLEEILKKIQELKQVG